MLGGQLRALGLKGPGLEGLAQPLADREVTEPLWASVATYEVWAAQRGTGLVKALSAGLMRMGSDIPHRRHLAQ